MIKIIQKINTDFVFRNPGCTVPHTAAPTATVAGAPLGKIDCAAGRAAKEFRLGRAPTSVALGDMPSQLGADGSAQ